MGISYQFLPNVLVGVAGGLAKPCFGSTIAVRRETLVAIGGFQALANQLADDYELGHAVRRLGLKVVLGPSAVEHLCAQTSLGATISQELRWARTIATVDPAGHAGSVVTFPLAWALIGLAFLPGPISLAAVLAAAFSRGILKARVDHVFAARSGPIWLLPVRDIFAFLIFLASFIGRSVEWRGQGFRVAADGALSETNGSH
jgi:ceramide glucosyltransferase